MKEEFISILQVGTIKEMVAFLQALSEPQKRELAPLVKTTYNDYLKYHEVINGTNTSFTQKANEKQKDMLILSSFACLTRTDFEKLEFPAWVLEKKILNLIVPWYCPPWFSDFVNQQASKEYILYFINYDWIVELSQKGLLQPSPELIVRILPNYIFENTNNVFSFKPEKLLLHPVTMAEHIWLLFDYESNLHFSDRFLYFGKEASKEKIGWTQAFLQYTKEGKIERRRILKESLQASHKNFNKVLSGWFANLFAELQPDIDESLALQKDLFNVLNAPHSKPVNTALQVIKKIMTDPGFDTTGFLDMVPVLLSSDTKATVVATLQILEKLGKQKTYRPQITLLVCQVFIHPEEELQGKAAKLILAHKDVMDERLQQELDSFQTGMLSTARSILSPLMGKAASAAIVETEYAATSPVVLNEIPAITSLDDLVFLASQVFDNNQSWHIDLLPAAIIQWQPQIRGQVIEQMEPALQRALKLIRSDFRTGLGYLDHMLSVFFIDVCIHWVRKYPDESLALQKMFDKFQQKDGDSIRKWLEIDPATNYMDGWDNHAQDPCYKPYKQLLLAALQKIKQGDQLPLLSTPTHQPGWILPETLVKRWAAYKQTGELPDTMDAQVAIARCWLEDTTEAIAMAKASLSGELLDIFLFLLDERKEPAGIFSDQACWISASLSKKEKKQYPVLEQAGFYTRAFENYTGQFEWEAVHEEYSTVRFDYDTRKEIPYTNSRKLLRVNFPKSKTKPAAIFLYDYLQIKAQFLSLEHNDIRRILFLTPNNTEPMLAQVLSKSLNNPAFWNEPDKRMVNACLQTLHEIWKNMGYMGHVFLGSSMLVSDKTAANTAVEIWIKAVNEQQLHSAQIGKAIGLQARIEFTPIKRLTDLLLQNMIRVSPLHNRSLQEIMEALLTELPEKPIKNLKKLLEIYAELLALNKSTTAKNLFPQLKEWSKTAGLQKLASSFS